MTAYPTEANKGTFVGYSVQEANELIGQGIIAFLIRFEAAEFPIVTRTPGGCITKPNFFVR